MTPRVRILEGLPAYGPMATPIPPEWGDSGREGTVVECETESDKWVANIAPGIGGLNLAHAHPNGRDAVVIASGDLYVVNPILRSAELLLSGVDSEIEVQQPDGWIFCIQGVALARLGSDGLLWHTRRLSWDGVKELKLQGHCVTGVAWSLDDHWYSFQVDAHTGQSQGGSYHETDAQRWEGLAVEP